MKTAFYGRYLGLNGMTILRSGSLIALGVFLASCSPSTELPPPPPRDTGKVIIRGSNTFGEELAPQLIAEYKKSHPSASFDLETKATAYGMGALMSSQCDIAGASRLPTKDELELAGMRNIQLKDNVIGAYSVAVVVNAANSVGNLTREQVRDIFTGVISNWKQVGGPDAPIHLYIRDPISGTYLGFKELAMENKPYADNPKLFTNYVGIVESVAQDPNGIGYSSFQRVKTAGIKAVTVGGSEPTVAEVNKGGYPYARVLHLYTNKDAESPATTEFIQFIQSPQGQAVINQMGYVPPHL